MTLSVGNKQVKNINIIELIVIWITSYQTSIFIIHIYIFNKNDNYTMIFLCNKYIFGTFFWYLTYITIFYFITSHSR